MAIGFIAVPNVAVHLQNPV